MYLFTFAVAWEIFHKDLGTKMFWFWPSFIIIFLTGVFTQIQIHYFIEPATQMIGGVVGEYILRNLPYLLPRLALYLPLAFMVREAFRRKHFVLVALSAMAAGELVSDALKTVSDIESIYLMQIRVDTIWPTLFSLMIIYDVLKMPALAFLNKTAASFKNTSIDNSFVIVDSLGGTTRAENRTEIENLKSVLSMDIDTLQRHQEEVQGAGELISSIVHEERFERQHLLSSSEVREYLRFYGIFDVESFLRINNIQTHIMQDIPGGSFVKKIDIESALGIKPE